MTFARRITRHPIPYDPAAGSEAVAIYHDLTPELRLLLAGAAGCSPYLKGLMATEAGWLATALLLSPETALQTVLSQLPQTAPDNLGQALRQAKRRVALLVALADLGGVWTLEEVTGALTRLADMAVHLALTTLAAEEIRRGRLPGMGPPDAASAGGMFALAMGKAGAHELNYSSDIDLICLFDDDRFAADDVQEARTTFIRITRKMTALLSDPAAGGYVFRTDLRLRPDASVTPVCLSMSAAETYYESLGRTWERAAYIKARPCGGDHAAGERFLAALVPFVWRKHLDFAAIQDAHDMRLRIRNHRGLHGPLVLEGHNLKLGLGGIRELEFFTQTRQIIAGGRDPSLRARGTVPALAALAAAGWIPPAVSDEMSALYRAHREVEHRLQMLRDAQTHDLPATQEGFDRLAHFMGESDTTALRRCLTRRFLRVAELTEGFFTPPAAATAPELSAAARDVVDRWRAYPALRSPRASEIFRRVQPQVLTRLARASDPDAALQQFDAFLIGLPAGVQVFSLFDANPQLIDLMVDIAATAPNLARYLGRNSGVLDAVIGGSFFVPWPGAEGLTGALGAKLAGLPDYERKLDATRTWAKEWHFRIGVHHLRGLVDAFEAGQHYADLAQAVVAALWPPCLAEFARKYGPEPGRGAVVLAMGSLGAGLLNAGSDLDLIVIYDGQGVEASAGPRPLATRSYYARLTKALITALTAPTAQGKLYDVDMRLRPSGRQGPVATSLQAFRLYQQTEAWTWEHLALTRARCVAGSAELGSEVEELRRDVLAQKGLEVSVIDDVAAMREKLRLARPGIGPWDAKLGPGRLQDIELLAEAGALRSGDPARDVIAQLAAGRRIGLYDLPDEEVLSSAWRLGWKIQTVTRLLGEDVVEPEQLGAGAKALLLRETGAASVAGLAESHATACAAAAVVVERVLATASTLAPPAQTASTEPSG